ncbi:hypothetical protein P152DRAFT_211873 [Eremomyces bilateralis CBS 781.70]|uniref:UBC core domain-containing protein n=1 Tax=Eremomyces bilateralis CBS 781.70 TaxID=1392243 RepID=A0A6G1FS69_9PEZI|nr:uncharacterized protein P152DRAFT_211873 [Eremomyces bilateralis CBS 781.70]KAF1808705.1 hypothetical protein P152DRAFT_211873 [Eremomyces bilateralis CBS 781.70]
MMHLSHLSSFSRQNLLLEFASLKHARPDGVYLSLSPGDVALWSGVMFVRKGNLSPRAELGRVMGIQPLIGISFDSGPYAPALLRFQISFPPDFPRSAPLLTFSTDVFHPLLTPLTTYTYSARDTDTVSSGDTERLPPGGFSLRYGFPQWYDRTGSAEAGPVTVYELLRYVQSAFTDESVLDSLPLDCVANPSAYHAWRTHHAQQEHQDGGMEKYTQTGAVSLHGSPQSKEMGNAEVTRVRRPGEWNWEGVWEERVRKGIQTSVSDVALFGGASGQDDIIRFSEVDVETAAKLSEDIQRLLDFTKAGMAIQTE